MEQGQRLENLSWRLWHLQNIMVDTDNAKSKRDFKKLSKCMSDKLDKEKGRYVLLDLSDCRELSYSQEHRGAAGSRLQEESFNRAFPAARCREGAHPGSQPAHSPRHHQTHAIYILPRPTHTHLLQPRPRPLRIRRRRIRRVRPPRRLRRARRPRPTLAPRRRPRALARAFLLRLLASLPLHLQTRTLMPIHTLRRHGALPLPLLPHLVPFIVLHVSSVQYMYTHRVFGSRRDW